MADININSIDDIKQLIKKHNMDAESKAYNRELLIEGFKNIQSRIEYNKKLKEAKIIDLDVNKMGGWIYNLIRDTIGGKINCDKLVVEWNINGEIIEFEPFSGEVRKCKQTST